MTSYPNKEKILLYFLAIESGPEIFGAHLQIFWSVEASKLLIVLHEYHSFLNLFIKRRE